MTDTKTYTPRTDSLASMCVGFFRNNPDEILTLDDIGDKFNATRGNIHTLLRQALDANLLVRGRDDLGDYIYTAGPALGASEPETIPAPAPAAGPLGKRPAPKGFTSPRHAVDLNALQVEEGVPYMATQAKSQSKWEPLFQKLTKPGLSIALPGHVKGALAAAVANRNKLQRGTFKVGMTGPNEARIWRLA